MKEFVVIVSCFLFHGGYCWKNTWDQPLQFTCDYDNGISWIKSIHSNFFEDRLWDFRCRNIEGISVDRCNWSGYVNSYDGAFTFRCSEDGYIAGVDSVNNDWYRDRIYSFYCCEPRGPTVMDACYFTSYNDFDQQIEHSVPNGYVWVGAMSHHSNWHEDRKFAFEFCKLEGREQQ